MARRRYKRTEASMLLIPKRMEGKKRSTMGIAIMLLDHAMRPRILHAIHTARPSISRQIPPAD